MVNLNHAYLYMLVKFKHIEWVSDTTVGHLRDVNQTIVVYANVDEGAKIGDIGDDTWKHHPLDKVIEGVNPLVELESFELLARVASGFLQFCYNISKGRHAHLCCNITREVDGIALGLVADKIRDRTVLVLGHLFYQGIAFGVNGRVVEWVLGLSDA